MNLYKHEQKCISTVTKGIIAHGVNCQGVMGSGAAGAIKAKWPKAYDMYQIAGSGTNLLGCAHLIKISENLFIFNIYSQEYYGSDGKIYADAEAVSAGLETVFQFAAFIKKLPIYMPEIGCGLGGLDWELDVEPIVNNFIEKFEVDTTVYFL